MSGGTVVQTADVPAERTAAGARTRTVLDCGTDAPGLVRRLIEVPPRSRLAGTAGGIGELWFVIGGDGHLEIDGAAGLELGPDRGVLIPPGSPYQVRGGEHDDLRLDVVTLPASQASQAGAAPAAAAPLTSDLAGCEVETTGDRKFRVLFGPGHGCSVATQFVGEIPPGRAPEHSHPYDEVVLILEGEGIAHVGGAQHVLATGACIHLPPGLPHCLENNGSALLRVLGVFHPADSPAAKLESPRQ